MQRTLPRRFLLHQIYGRAGHGQHHRRQRRREDEAARAVDEQLPQSGAAGRIGAEGSQGLSQGAHLHQDPVPEAQLRHHAGAVGPPHPGGVGLVHHHHGVVALGQLHHLPQRRDVPVHAEDRFGDDELPRVGGRIFQQALQVLHVAVAVHRHRRPREPAAVDDAGMVQLVAEDQVVFLHQRGDDSHVGLVSAVEHQRRFGSLETRDAPLQLLVRGHVARDQPGRSRAAAVAVQRLPGGFLQRGMVGEPQVVVGGEVQHLPPVEADGGVLLAVDDLQLPVEVPALELLQPAFDEIGHGYCSEVRVRVDIPRPNPEPDTPRKQGAKRAPCRSD